MKKQFLGNDEAYQNMVEYLHLIAPGPILLEGPAGLGKTRAAYSIAAEFLCCEPDSLLEQNDFMVIGDTHSQIKVEDIQTILSKSSIVGTSKSGLKAYLILDAGNMTVQAQNMLLKLLEDYALSNKVILTCNGASPLETIISRCYRVYFKPLEDKQVINYLKSKGICESSLPLASGLCHGCPYIWDSINEAFASLEKTYQRILSMKHRTEFFNVLNLLKEKDKENFYDCHAAHWEEGISLFFYLFTGILNQKLGLPFIEAPNQPLSQICELYTLSSTYKVLQTLLIHKKMTAYTRNDFFELVKVFVES